MGRFSLNGSLVQLGEKYVEYKNGIISLNVTGTHFPYSNYEPPSPNTSAFMSTYFRVVSLETNQMTVDYGDGVIETYTTKSNIFEFRPSIPLGDATRQINHTYTDAYSGVRTIKIKFSKPDKIKEINVNLVDLYGNLPNELSTLNSLESLIIAQSKITSFPVSISDNSNIKNLTLSRIGTAISLRIPDEFLSMRLETFGCSNSVDFSDVITSNFVAFLNGGSQLTLKTLIIDTCNLSIIPNDIVNLTSLKTLVSGGNNIFETMPSKYNELTTLENLSIGAGVFQNNFIKYWSNIDNLTSLKVLTCTVSANMETNLPNGLENCELLKTFNMGGSFQTILRVDEFVNNLYNFVTLNASKTAGNTKFRQMTITTYYILAGTVLSATPTGVFQEPTGFVLGSNNGTPSSPKEMIWVLVNQYQHTFIYE